MLEILDLIGIPKDLPIHSNRTVRDLLRINQNVKSSNYSSLLKSFRCIHKIHLLIKDAGIVVNISDVPKPQTPFKKEGRRMMAKLRAIFAGKITG